MFQNLSQLEAIRSSEKELLKATSPLDTLILTELFRAAPSPLMTKTLINVTQHERRAVRKSIDYLVRQKLVEEINNPIDKRAKYYTLSMKGINQFKEFLAQLSTNN